MIVYYGYALCACLLMRCVLKSPHLLTLNIFYWNLRGLSQLSIELNNLRPIFNYKHKTKQHFNTWNNRKKSRFDKEKWLVFKFTGNLFVRSKLIGYVLWINMKNSGNPKVRKNEFMVCCHRCVQSNVGFRRLGQWKKFPRDKSRQVQRFIFLQAFDERSCKLYSCKNCWVTFIYCKYS